MICTFGPAINTILDFNMSVGTNCVIRLSSLLLPTLFLYMFVTLLVL